ncbi:MAG: 50S ribosomal protein L22 [Patescibacteria group bacterium]|nr:50S ribosomal protein L22 [Patescibacteria group bacterium]
MKTISAKLNYLRTSPRKVRLVADLIRGKSVESARAILQFTFKKSTDPMAKLLNSAIANAKNDFKVEDEAILYVSKITVDEGPKYKRWMPRARGAVSGIKKRTSKITLVLSQAQEKKQRIKGDSKMKEKEKEKSKPQKIEGKKKKIKFEYPKLKTENKKQIPKVERGVKRIFRRKAF